MHPTRDTQLVKFLRRGLRAGDAGRSAARVEYRRSARLVLSSGAQLFLTAAEGFPFSRAAALRGIFDPPYRELNGPSQGGQRVSNPVAGAQPNKPMQPTATSAAVIENLALITLYARRLIGSVRNRLDVAARSKQK